MTDSTRTRTWPLVVILIALPLATFGRVLRHGFVNWDDQSQLYQNPDFNPPTFAKVSRYWTRPHMDLYLPVTYTIWGGLAAVAQRDTRDSSGAMLDARYFHAANLLCHIGATLLVFAILLTLGLPKIPSALGAAVFSVHPLVVEPVAWASALYTVLSGMLSLAAVWMYLRWARGQSEGTPRSMCYAVGAALFILAMLSKPSAVVAPAIAFVLDWLILRRPLREVARSLALWLLLAAPFAVVVNRTQGADFVPDTPLYLRPLLAADAVAFTLVKIVAPVRLAVDYGRSPMWLLDSPQRCWTWLLPAALLFTAWMVRRRSGWVLASLLLVVVGMAPFLGLVKFDFQYASTVADRYAYLSLFGLAVSVAGLVTGWQTRSGVLLVACITLVLAGLSFQRTGAWKDTRTLFGATLEVNPDSLVAHNVLGFLESMEGNAEEAIVHYRASLRTRPGDAGANYNLANALLARGELDEAIAHYRVAAAAPGTSPDVRMLNNLAAALARNGQLVEAESHFTAALRIDPHYEPAVNGLERVRRMRREATTSPVTLPGPP